ncbi:MAG: rhodanese-like domain-containing protein [Akkermansiaceae bacterium]|jgi:rhodanese-related sulfurtransferase
MRNFLLSLSGICLLSGAAAWVTFLVVGPPDRSVACDPDDLPEYHVCLSTVREWESADVLWVDARPRKDWEKDGIKGSVLVNDQEDWNDLELGFLTVMVEEPKPKVVVYCNQSGCGSSKYVANELRKRHSADFGFEVFVLEGGSKALAAEQGSRD